jgi:peroxiredoxin
MSQLQARNAVVFGVSADTIESHKAFAAKEKLNFPLLSDTEHTMIAAYGALMPNGKFANRYTFIIGPDGKIAGIDRNVAGQFERSGSGLTSHHGLALALLLSDWKAKIGQPVPYFSLPNYDGKTVGHSAGKKATVVAFLGTKCMISGAYDERLTKLAGDPAYKEVAFVGIDSNVNELSAAIKDYAQKKALPYPVARDASNAIADHFAARATPTVWVLDGKGVAVYQGAIDDNSNAALVKSAYLKDALDAVLAGKPVPVVETKAQGCAIKRAPKKK